MPQIYADIVLGAEVLKQVFLLPERVCFHLGVQLGGNTMEWGGVGDGGQIG